MLTINSFLKSSFIRFLKYLYSNLYFSTYVSSWYVFYLKPVGLTCHGTGCFSAPPRKSGHILGASYQKASIT